MLQPAVVVVAVPQAQQALEFPLPGATLQSKTKAKTSLFQHSLLWLHNIRTPVFEFVFHCSHAAAAAKETGNRSINTHSVVGDDLPWRICARACHPCCFRPIPFRCPCPSRTRPRPLCPPAPPRDRNPFTRCSGARNHKGYNTRLQSKRLQKLWPERDSRVNLMNHRACYIERRLRA